MFTMLTENGSAGHEEERRLLMRYHVDEEDGDSLAGTLGADDLGFGLVEEAATIERLMLVLDERQREVIRLRFEEELLQREIGNRIGVSQMHVSRMIRQSIAVMQQAADTEGTLRT
jgi:RNA polymerase sigma-B factor